MDDSNKNVEWLEQYLSSFGFRTGKFIVTTGLSPLGGGIRILMKQQNDKYFLYDEDPEEDFRSGRSISSVTLSNLTAHAMIHRLEKRRWWHDPIYEFSIGQALGSLPILTSALLMLLSVLLLVHFDEYVPQVLKDWFEQDGNLRLFLSLFLLFGIFVVSVPIYLLIYKVDSWVSGNLTAQRSGPFYEEEQEISPGLKRERPLSKSEWDTFEAFVNDLPDSTDEDEESPPADWETLDADWRRATSPRYKRIGFLLGYPLRAAFLPKIDNHFGRGSFSDAVILRIIGVSFVIGGLIGLAAIVSYLLLVFGLTEEALFSRPEMRIGLWGSGIVLFGYISITTVFIMRVRRNVKQWRKSKRERYRAEFLRLATAMLVERKVSDVRLADGLEDYIYRSAYY